MTRESTNGKGRAAWVDRHYEFWMRVSELRIRGRQLYWQVLGAWEKTQALLAHQRALCQSAQEHGQKTYASPERLQSTHEGEQRSCGR